MVPDGTAALVRAGHEVFVENAAGVGSGFAAEEIAAAEARLVDVDAAWSEVDLIVKVKEPNPQEVERLRAGQTLFTYLHLAAAPKLVESLQAADIQAIAY
jgi:alanine dehydrogenase